VEADTRAEGQPDGPVEEAEENLPDRK